MTKSIDGINRTPVKHEIYLAKRPLGSYRHEPIIFLQRRTGDTLNDEVLSSINLDLSTRRQHELVINVSKKLSIRASISIIIQYILIAGIAVASAYSTDIGQWFVLILALYVLITRQDSRLTFGIALFILVSVPFFQVINQPGVAVNMSVYVYQLLVLGYTQTLLELWIGRNKTSKRMKPVHSKSP